MVRPIQQFRAYTNVFWPEQFIFGPATFAIGAKPRDVLLKFLREAVAICLAGWVAGILLANAAAVGISAASSFQVDITSGAVVMVCGFSTLVGVFLGSHSCAQGVQAGARGLLALRVANRMLHSVGFVLHCTQIIKSKTFRVENITFFVARTHQELLQNHEIFQSMNR
ncbi:ABC transporter permease [Massilia sp. Root418]|uniref:ABC transporter permease n=1 Tax=Massilia sp. Root418 TaxID=1736532 RepID=UPI00138F2F11|nr:FtsX-like permease family protein [Massilia sp. Root418]